MCLKFNLKPKKLARHHEGDPHREAAARSSGGAGASARLRAPARSSSSSPSGRPPAPTCSASASAAASSTCRTTRRCTRGRFCRMAPAHARPSARRVRAPEVRRPTPDASQGCWSRRRASRSTSWRRHSRSNSARRRQSWLQRRPRVPSSEKKNEIIKDLSEN